MYTYIASVQHDYIDSNRDFYAEGCRHLIIDMVADSLAREFAQFVRSDEQEGEIKMVMHLRRTQYGGIEIT